MHIYKRTDLPALLVRAGLLGEGAEIGVDRGEHARSILSAWPGKMLHLIDSWDCQFEAQGAKDLYDSAKAEAEVRAWAANEPRARIWKQTSNGAAWTTFRPEHRLMDWAFIDAGHGYADAKNDCALWWDRVRPGGVLAGHDYCDGYFQFGANLRDGVTFGVQSAVDRHCLKQGLQARYTSGEQWKTWYVWKPDGPRPNVAVFSGARDDYPGKLDATQNHESYCRCWHYQYQMGIPDISELHWYKVHLLAQVIERNERPDCEWLAWIDADALFTNFRRPLGGLAHGTPFHLVAGWSDVGAENTGVFLVRNSATGLNLLRRWLGVRSQFNVTDYDNAAFRHLLKTDAEFARDVEVVPHRLLNSYPQFNLWGPSDLIGHFPGSGLRRADLIRHMAAWAADCNK